MDRIVAKTTAPADLLNEWVVEVDGVRRARFVGQDAPFRAAREANSWRKTLETTPQGDQDVH